MKEINLASVIATKRKERGVTQDQLAAFIGVSKASVSKWETGQSYPDITFLPPLAAYFTISIDELMGYSPQLEQSAINELYIQLAEDFARLPFTKVIANCATIIKKYYSCFPLLLYIAKLYTNHFMLAESLQQQEALLHETVALCERIQKESGDVRLNREAVLYQAICCLALKNPQEVLDLLGDRPKRILAEGILVSQAYQSMGAVDKAKETLQAELYQYVMASFQILLNILQQNMDTFGKAEEAYVRAADFARIFNMKHLNPNNVILLDALGAQMYCANHVTEKALALLDEFVDTCVGDFFPFALQGDSFFDLVDPFLHDFEASTPRSEKVIKESMLHDILMNPAFDALHDHREYQRLVQKMQKFLRKA